MSEFIQLKTKKAKLQFIKKKLNENDIWVLRGLVSIYNQQTKDEKKLLTVKEHNGFGFTRIDAELLSSFAERLISKCEIEKLKSVSNIKISDFFSEKQELLIRKKLPKYAGQLLKIALLKK
jgi:hypothetical protein